MFFSSWKYTTNDDMNKCDILNKSYCIVIAYYVFYF